jgi:hypothetical protein
MNRIVVTDDGTRIRVTVYPQGVVEPLAVVELSPEQGVRLCAELTAAISRHFALRAGTVQ